MAAMTMKGIDDGPVPSIGLAAVCAMGLEPEKERWWSVLRERSVTGVATKPGEGNLQHHLGTLSRDT
jgi:hypothetical protein